METKDVILELRTKRGLSQDDLAGKVMVTRQAVSRWENGDTVPNTDTLKLLSKEFDVSINTLLGEPRKLICQCCGMPLEDDAIMGRDSDGALNEDYCKWCYADGTYTYSNMDDLIDVCVKNMVGENFTEEQARAYMKQLLPKLDYWKRYESLSDGGQFEAFKRQLIDEINEKADNIEGELIEIQKNIKAVNDRLMLLSMDYFSEKIEKNKLESKEIDDWIANIRVELKKNVIRKQNRDINNREIYSYLHDIFGAEVLDLFDIEYDDPMVFNANNANTDNANNENKGN